MFGKKSGYSFHMSELRIMLFALLCPPDPHQPCRMGSYHTYSTNNSMTLGAFMKLDMVLNFHCLINSSISQFPTIYSIILSSMITGIPLCWTTKQPQEGFAVPVKYLVYESPISEISQVLTLDRHVDYTMHELPTLATLPSLYQITLYCLQNQS